MFHPALVGAPQIEPILSGNLPPGFDSSTCRSWICASHSGFLSSYGFVNYYNRRSVGLAIITLNGRNLFGQPIKVNWAYASSQREDTSMMQELCETRRRADRGDLGSSLSAANR
ncbi:hypothetical protein Droror1_Dr00006838 [Drosera rotundifolia]